MEHTFFHDTTDVQILNQEIRIPYGIVPGSETRLRSVVHPLTVTRLL